MTIIGVSMMGNFDKRAWILGMVNQMIASVYYILTGQYGFILMTTALFYYSVKNLMLWDKAKKGKDA